MGGQEVIHIVTGNALAILKNLPNESVHCCVTSPPYWGLRDYGVDGQLGLERSLGEYIEVMVGVFREVKRVLRDDGTLWLNLGDSYAASPNGRAAADIVNDDRTFRDKPFNTIGPIYDPAVPRRSFDDGNTNKGNPHSGFGGRIVAGGYLKSKDLCGIPWRVAFALQADGWWLRQDIIWAKPNPMPESVTDRCTKAHEYIFMLSKSARYYYDQDAIAEPAAYVGVTGQDANGFKNPLRFDGKMAASKKQDGHSRRHAGFNDRWDNAESRGECATTRNKRSVWEIATAAFSEAHFATFPPALIEPCIKAGCPKGGTVLDPFSGAGTTGLVADRLERNAILIELNPEYVDLARRRIRNDSPLFASVTVA